MIDRNIKPTVLAMSEAKARVIATKAINDGIYEKLGESVDYEELINVLRDTNGNITMLQANTVKMNKLSSETALSIQEKIIDVGTRGISIPLGTAFGSQMLANMGPDINIKILPYGAVEADFVTEFENAGINQTRHKIYLKVTTAVRIVVPLTSEKISVTTHVPIAETIIVGNVPDSYVNVDEKDKMYNLIPRK